MANAVIRARLPVDDIANHHLSTLGVQEHDWVIMDPLSIGDACQTLCLLKAFRRTHMRPGERLFYICRDRSLPLVEMFGVADVAVGAPLDYNVAFLFAQRYSLGPGRPIAVGPAMYADGWLQRLIDHGLISVLHARRLILGLDLDCEISHAVPTEESRREAAETALANGVEIGTSLLIVNHATTSRPLPAEAYAEIIERFPGPVFYDATVASAPDVPGARPISIPLSQMIPLSELFGTVLAIRSGIVDLLADARIRLFTVYPRPEDAQTWVKDRAAWVNAYRNITLQKMGMAGRGDERPIFLDAGDGVPEISARILAAFDEHLKARAAA